MAKLKDVIAILTAGGPGSGRKPEWQKDSPNKEKLDSMHSQLTSQYGAMKYNFSSKQEDGSIAHVYVPKKKEKYGFAHGQKIIESPIGRHKMVPS